MNREIKFRAKCKYTKEFIYGDLLHTLDGIRICEEDGDYEIISETIGQYTEQNDVNGDEIYEGMTVHQVAVLIGAPEIDFTGEVKFYAGSWWIDNKKDAVLLFNEACENTIITGEE